MIILAKANLTQSILKFGPFKKELKNKLKVLHKQAIEAWLRTVLKETPVYTGTVRGTFKPVGRIIGKAISSIGPVNKRAASKTHFIYPKGGKKVPLGFSKGESYADAERLEKDLGNSLEYTFIFARDLLYAAWNEIQPAPSWLRLVRPTPWHALDKAATSWDIFVRNDIFKVLPPLTHGLTIVKIRAN